MTRPNSFKWRKTSPDLSEGRRSYTSPWDTTVEGMRSSLWRWHLDEMFVKINAEKHYPWWTVDHEGGGLESFDTKTRDRNAACPADRTSS